MPEKITSNYVSLFDIRLIYHDRTGTDDFDALSEKEQEEYLSAYDSRSFFLIVPIERTKKIIKKFGCIYKNTSLGCILAASDASINFLSEQLFEFQIKVFNKELHPSYAGGIFSHISEDRSCRFKEVFMFSNGTGGASSSGQNENIFFFSKKDIDRNEATSSTENKYVAAICKNDAPRCMLPLNDDISEDLFAFIQLTAGKQTEQGRLIFEIHFKQCERAKETTEKKLNGDRADRNSLFQRIRNSLSGR